MNYQRVIPRDLFNEAKLLKCLGQLTLMIHDNKCPFPITFEYDESDSGFIIVQDETSGDILCSNIVFYYREKILIFFTGLNSRLAYPLCILAADDSGVLVFNDDGTFSRKFIEAMDKF